MFTFDESMVSVGALAVVAAGMRRVAMADGEMDAAELALIEDFETTLPEHIDDAARVLTNDVERSLYIRFLALTALCDHALTESEEQTIHELAREHGVDEADATAAIHATARAMFATFAGVSIFREEAIHIGSSLGLTAEQVNTMMTGES
ncbi:MAG: hypothetical protein ACON4N_05360 [Myxococcota bacterium]